MQELAYLGREFHTFKELLGHLFLVAREEHYPLRWHAKDGGVGSFANVGPVANQVGFRDCGWRGIAQMEVWG